MRSNVLIIVLIFSLYACSSDNSYNEPQFIEEHEITGKCLSDDLMISYAYDMAVEAAMSIYWHCRRANGCMYMTNMMEGIWAALFMQGKVRVKFIRLCL